MDDDIKRLKELKDRHHYFGDLTPNEEEEMHQLDSLLSSHLELLEQRAIDDRFPGIDEKIWELRSVLKIGCENQMFKRR